MTLEGVEARAVTHENGITVTFGAGAWLASSGSR